MAKGEVNKSEAIRIELGNKPEASAQEIVDSLEKKGINATTALVYNVRAQIREKEQEAEKERRKAMKAAANEDKAAGKSTAKEAAQVVLKIKGLATELGGINSLKQVVDALAE